MSLLSRLFGGSSTPAPKPEAEVYRDFRILAEPVKEGGSYRMTARIEKEIDGEVKSHVMIRADTFSSLDTAVEMSTSKAKALIDQQGNKIFD